MQNISTSTQFQEGQDGGFSLRKMGKRMKWSKLGRTALATVVSLGMGLGITACSRDYVVAFLYVPSSGSSEGLINAYQVSFQVGALMQMSTSPVSTGYRNPVALSATSDGKYVYVVHRDDSKIVQYAVGTDGKLYGQNTYDSIGSSTYPVALNITPDNAFIYVLNTYQPGYSSASTGPGNITVYKVSSTDGSLTAQPSLTVNIGYAPVSVVTSTYNNFLYVVQQDTTAGNRNLLGFTRNTTTGALTPLSGTTLGNGTTTVTSGYYSGVTPSSVVEDPRSRFLYVTDRDSNQVIGYTLGSTGVPALITSSPWSTGLRPLNATIDPRGYYLYTANYGANSVSAYSIDQSTGALTGSATSSSTTVGTGPQCVTIEPALGKYMFTANYLDNTTSGLQLDSHNGGLTNIQNSPFATSSRPSCALAIANGTHATQTVKP